MKKIIALAVLFLSVVGLAAANAPLKDFKYNIDDGAETDLVGGQEGFVQANFSNVANQPMPLVLNFTLSSDELVVTGEELNVKEVKVDSTSSLPGGDGTSQSADLTDDCRTRSGTENAAWYTCRVTNQDEVLPKSRNVVDFRTESVPYIKPGTYSFELEVISTVGVATGSSRGNVSGGSGTLDVEDEDSGTSASVSIQTEGNATAELKLYDNVSASAPSDSQDFLGAVDVNVTNSSTGKKADSSGTVTINYNQDRIERRGLDEGTMDVYYYEEETGTWTSEETNVTNHDIFDNTITAEVPHFSVYAAYASEEEEDSDDGGSSTFTVDDEEEQTQEQNETVQNDTEGEPPQPPTSPESGETGTEEDTGQETDEETGEETGEQPESPQNTGQGSGLTGTFLDSPTGQAGAFIVGLLLASGLIYRYRGDEVKQKAAELQKKAEDLR